MEQLSRHDWEDACPRLAGDRRDLTLFAKRRTTAQQRYSEFVMQGIKSASIWGELQQQIYLGDEKFVKRVQRKVGLQGDELSIPRAQRRVPAPALAKIAAKYHERNDAIYAAYATGGYSYREIAEYYGLHLATVGRVIRGRMLQCEN